MDFSWRPLDDTYSILFIKQCQLHLVFSEGRASGTDFIWCICCNNNSFLITSLCILEVSLLWYLCSVGIWRSLFPLWHLCRKWRIVLITRLVVLLLVTHTSSEGSQCSLWSWIHFNMLSQQRVPVVLFLGWISAFNLSNGFTNHCILHIGLGYLPNYMIPINTLQCIIP